MQPFVLIGRFMPDIGRVVLIVCHSDAACSMVQTFGRLCLLDKIVRRRGLVEVLSVELRGDHWCMRQRLVLITNSL